LGQQLQQALDAGAGEPRGELIVQLFEGLAILVMQSTVALLFQLIDLEAAIGLAHVLPNLARTIWPARSPGSVACVNRIHTAAGWGHAARVLGRLRRSRVIWGACGFKKQESTARISRAVSAAAGLKRRYPKCAEVRTLLLLRNTR